MNKLSRFIRNTIIFGSLLSPLSTIYANTPIVIPSLAPMLEKTVPSVVHIAVETTDDDQETDEKSKTVYFGSGVIIDAQKGYIVTNAHVVKDQKIMIATLNDGRRYHTRLIGKDDGFDIAVLQIRAKNLTQLPFGNSEDLKVGDFVVAVGNPFGLKETVTAGMISALNREDQPHLHNFQSFIQTDASINPGNSGGALIDLQGHLVGINTAILTAAEAAGNVGIGFAIPSNMVRSVAQQLIKYGRVERGVLGVTAQNITSELNEAFGLKESEGALVTKVTPASPAAKAGIKVKDIIQAIDHTRIRSSKQLHNMLGLIPPETTVEITVLRDHKTLKLKAVIGDVEKLSSAKHELPFLGGMRLQEFYDLEPDSTTLKGILVADVNDESQAALAGLQVGDVILSANGETTSNIEKLVEIVKHKPKQLLLKVARGDGRLFLVIQQELPNHSQKVIKIIKQV